MEMRSCNCITKSKRPNTSRHQSPILCSCMEEQTTDCTAHPTPAARREVGRSDDDGWEGRCLFQGRQGRGRPVFHRRQAANLRRGQTVHTPARALLAFCGFARTCIPPASPGGILVLSYEWIKIYSLFANLWIYFRKNPVVHTAFPLNYIETS